MLHVSFHPLNQTDIDTWIFILLTPNVSHPFYPILIWLLLPVGEGNLPHVVHILGPQMRGRIDVDVVSIVCRRTCVANG